jgi:parallel beta-helix repeat protein
MKTLDQVEARRPISQPVAPATFPIVISATGSYYLTGNITATNSDAIRINANDVSLDLNGFLVTTATPGTGIGVKATTAANGFAIKRASICNGKISSFAEGVSAGEGSHYERLEVEYCTQIGLNLGLNSVIQECTANDNSGTHAIKAADYCSISNCTAELNESSQAAIAGGVGTTIVSCTASWNTGKYGISVGDNSAVARCTVTRQKNLIGVNGVGINPGAGSTIDHCTVRECTGVATGISSGKGSTLDHCSSSLNANNSGAAATGISLDDGASATGCTVNSNSGNGINTGTGCSVIHCTSLGNYSGMFAGLRSTIRGCTFSENTHEGLSVNGECIVAENQVSGNGTTTPSPGIVVFGAGNRIESNNTTGNAVGIRVANPGNLVIRNSNRGGTIAFDIAAGNSKGEEINVFNASTTTTITSSNPWANFRF